MNTLASLPNELIIIIFNFIKKITDKRQFLKTCKLHNTLLKGLITEMSDAELNYFKINDDEVGYEEKNRYYFMYMEKRDYCVEKFMMELCYDSYFDMIPLIYITKNINNTVIIKLLIKYGKLELLQFAINKRHPSLQLYKLATESGQLDILIWLSKHGYGDGIVTGLIIGIGDIAGGKGHLDILKWAMEHDCGFSSNAYLNAAKNGHVHILEWATENGYHLASDILPEAARYGHLNILVWAKKKGYYLRKNICANAAINGHLHILKWARENGCGWNSVTCANTAFNNQLETLKWARANGCEWDKFTIEIAIENESWDVLKWARENSCPE